MAPSREQAHFTKGVIAYMGYISEQTSSRHDKKIARSPEFKRFLLYLSGRAPLIMNRLLKQVSRKCEEALRVEKEPHTGRKRPAPPARNENNAKRLRSVAEEATVRRPAEDDDEDEDEDEDVPMKNERTSLQSIVQSSAMAPSHTSVSEKDKESSGENSEKLDPDTKPAENELSNGALQSVYAEREDDTAVQPTSYEIGFGLWSGSPIVENHVKTSLLALEPSTTRPSFDIHDEINNIWRIIRLLEFYKTRRDLYQHLENREKMPCEKLQARTTWDSSDPSEILETLENVKRNTIDNKVHRAYGQTMLVQSVNAQVARGYNSTDTGHRSDHTSLLEELARKKAGPVSKTEVDQTIASYFYEYYAGKKWLGVIDWFGGNGIVLVFVIAEIGYWHIRNWTEFQRKCVQHLAGLLRSIKGLVGALGPNALERYCRQGCLGQDYVDKVKMAEFTRPDTEEEPEEDELGDEESGVDESDNEESEEDKSGNEEPDHGDLKEEESKDQKPDDEEYKNGGYEDDSSRNT